VRLRVSELARRAGISVQQVRTYADRGLLPPVERTASGYRVFTTVHERALHTVRRMAAGHGWQRTGEIMRAVHEGRVEAALALLDDSHAELSRERAALVRVLGAFDALAGSAGRTSAVDSADRPSATLDEHRPPQVLAGLTAPPAPVAPARGRRIGEVAELVGVRTSALRVWEAMGLLRPGREQATGYRLYDAREVRKAQVLALLRRAHYPLPTVAAVMRELESTGNPQRLRAALDRRSHDLHRLSLLRLDGSAALHDYLSTVLSVDE
jgi:DNA-binding transcriptional MerR regulator